MTDRLHPCDQPFSRTLAGLADSLPPEGLTLGELLERLGPRGLLALCMVLTVPFLLPASVPGSSTPFGLVIALIGLQVAAGRSPRLPGRMVDRPIAAENLLPVLQKGAWLFGRMERVARPRLPALTRGRTPARINAMVMVISAILLMAPLPLPFSNTLPAYGVLFLAAGSLERDGCLVLAGYLMVALTAVYFGLLALLGMAGLQALFPGGGF
ncbi:MAG: exopolysaccharide biosynthesis protein [Peptococcaceae bacterium]|nr:exopolysaccharide biosynthesis protein [Peptococcaceae bacterium]